ncbi:hypothetical protein [Nocardia sp. NBC_00403]|uniref:hypothetical protein n=1 Tax=Nocardia sp. NBC_00403 TaxID=2975990 RepID=UPI002E1B435E
MFEYWSDDFTASLRHVVDPPIPVRVDLNVAISPQGAFRKDAVSMRVKAGGLDLTTAVPGLLYAWARCISLHLAISSTESAAALRAAPARHG